MRDTTTTKFGGGRKIFAAVMLGLIFSSAAPSLTSAQNSELQPVLDRLQRLERDIRTLNISIARGGNNAPALVSGSPENPAAGAAGIARLDTRLGQLEEDLRASTGKIETMTYQLQQINQRLEKLIADIDYRLSAMESSRANPAMTARVNAASVPVGVQQAVPGGSQPGVLGTLNSADLNAQPPAAGGNTAVAAVTVQPPPAAPVSVLPPGGPKVRYKYAFSLLRQADYNKAEAAFSEFVKIYGDDPLTGNARYWLGETYYVRGRYVEAAEVFLAAYQGDEKGAKAPDTLLKLGMSLGNLDKKAQACASFDKLLADYPKAPPTILGKVTSERRKNGCE